MNVVNYRKVINNRYENKTVVKVRFKQIGI